MLRIEPTNSTQTPINTSFRNKTTSTKLSIQKLARLTEEIPYQISQGIFSRPIKPNSELKNIENFIAQKIKKIGK